MESQHADANKSSRFWNFTVNNPMGQFIGMPEGFRYLISGVETSESGTKHLQCYSELSRAHNRRWMSNRIPTAGGINIRYENSSGTACVNYCKKGEQSHDEWDDLGIDGPTYGRNADVFEVGEVDKVDQPKGKRNDLDQQCTSLMSGMSLKEVAKQSPATYVRNYRGLTNFRNLLGTAKPIDRPFTVTLVYGKTRYGKSYWVRDTNPGLFVKPIGKGLWFDEYANQDVVLIDEFRGQYPLGDILQVLDCYLIQVETKGGHVNYQPDFVYLTTNLHPYRMYADHDQDTRDAFFARFHEVVWFYEKRKFRILHVSEMKAFFDDPNWGNNSIVPDHEPYAQKLSSDVAGYNNTMPRSKTTCTYFDFPSEMVTGNTGIISSAVNFEPKGGMTIPRKAQKKRKALIAPLLHDDYHAQSDKRKGVQKIRKFMNARHESGISPSREVVDVSSTGEEYWTASQVLSETESVDEITDDFKINPGIILDTPVRSKYTPSNRTQFESGLLAGVLPYDDGERADLFAPCACCQHVPGTKEWADVHRLDGLGGGYSGDDRK